MENLASQIVRDTDKALTITNVLVNDYFGDAEPNVLAIRHEWSELYNYLEIVSDYLRSAKTTAEKLSGN